MKALQIIAPGQSVIIDVPMPHPGPGQVLLRIEAVTTCPQWDLHLRHNEPMFVGHRFVFPYPPGQPGHEATGEIAAIGSGVVDLKPGDCVSAWRDAGQTIPGCYAQYVVHHAENVIRVPAKLPPEAVAPLELAMCVGSTFLMLRSMDAVKGRRFAVSGLGPAGLIALQMARAEGASTVHGFDFNATRREYALTVGLDAASDPREPTTNVFPARPAASAIDCAIDCVGGRSSAQFLMDHTADVVALFGVQREDYTFSPRHYRGLRLCGYPGHHRAAAEYALDLIRRDLLDLSPLVTHHLPLERYQEGIDLLERQEAIKVCFYPWQDS